MLFSISLHKYIFPSFIIIIFVFHRLLSFGGSAVLLFAPVDVIKSLKLQDVLVSTDSGVVVSPKGSNVLFATKAREPNLFTRPTQVIIVSSDR